MGAWGVALFLDDTECDIRNEYREMIEDGVEDDEATRRVLAANSQAFADEDDGSVAWLALAMTQKIGRLTHPSGIRALEILDSGADLQRWSDNPANLARRGAVLDKVRAQLVGAQPKRKKLRPPKKDYVTTLEAGDVLSFVGSNRRIALVRVARIEESRHSIAPILRVLRYCGTTVPPGVEIAALPDRPRLNIEPPPSPPPPWWSVMWRATAHGDEDYDKVGLRLVANIAGRPGDDIAEAWTYWLLVRLDKKPRARTRERGRSGMKARESTALRTCHADERPGRQRATVVPTSFDVATCVSAWLYTRRVMRGLPLAPRSGRQRPGEPMAPLTESTCVRRV